MDKYKCILCSKQFSTKGNYIQHQQRLTSCYITNNIETCKYCNKTFTNKYNRVRHENTVCLEILNQQENKEHETIIKEMNELKEKNKKLEEIINNVIISLTIKYDFSVKI